MGFVDVQCSPTECGLLFIPFVVVWYVCVCLDANGRWLSHSMGVPAIPSQGTSICWRFSLGGGNRISCTAFVFMSHAFLHQAPAWFGLGHTFHQCCTPMWCYVSPLALQGTSECGSLFAAQLFTACVQPICSLFAACLFFTLPKIVHSAARLSPAMCHGLPALPGLPAGQVLQPVLCCVCCFLSSRPQGHWLTSHVIFSGETSKASRLPACHLCRVSVGLPVASPGLLGPVLLSVRCHSCAFGKQGYAVPRPVAFPAGHSMDPTASQFVRISVTGNRLMPLLHWKYNHTNRSAIHSQILSITW